VKQRDSQQQDQLRRFRTTELRSPLVPGWLHADESSGDQGNRKEPPRIMTKCRTSPLDSTSALGCRRTGASL
jgi:hypothetical protein